MFWLQAAGWGIVIGFGAFFALFASVLVYLDIAFSGQVSYPLNSHSHQKHQDMMTTDYFCPSQQEYNSEHFNTGRVMLPLLCLPISCSWRGG